MVRHEAVREDFKGMLCCGSQNLRQGLVDDVRSARRRVTIGRAECQEIPPPADVRERRKAETSFEHAEQRARSGPCDHEQPYKGLRYDGRQPRSLRRSAITFVAQGFSPARDQRGRIASKRLSDTPSVIRKRGSASGGSPGLTRRAPSVNAATYPAARARATRSSS